MLAYNFTWHRRLSACSFDNIQCYAHYLDMFVHIAHTKRKIAISRPDFLNEEMSSEILFHLECCSKEWEANVQMLFFLLMFYMIAESEGVRLPLMELQSIIKFIKESCQLVLCELIQGLGILYILSQF